MNVNVRVWCMYNTNATFNFNSRQTYLYKNVGFYTSVCNAHLSEQKHNFSNTSRVDQLACIGFSKCVLHRDFQG